MRERIGGVGDSQAVTDDTWSIRSEKRESGSEAGYLVLAGDSNMVLRLRLKRHEDDRFRIDYVAVIPFKGNHDYSFHTGISHADGDIFITICDARRVIYVARIDGTSGEVIEDIESVKLMNESNAKARRETDLYAEEFRKATQERQSGVSPSQKQCE